MIHIPEPDIPDALPDVIFKEAVETVEEKQVIVHCFLSAESSAHFIRIWHSTYLRDKDSRHKSKLLTAFNITFFPQWMYVSAGTKTRFTLVFEALPSDCTFFDLFEDIPEGGGFYTGLIPRNKTDVYEVDILS